MFEILSSTLRLSTPLLLAATGGLICERSGIATICLEGVMLMGAWMAAAANVWTGSPTLAVAAGLAAGTCMITLHAFLCIKARADHIISGVAVNLIAAGATPLLCKALFGNSTNTPSIPMKARLPALPIPGISEIPLLGDLLFNQTGLVYLALLLPFLVQAFLSFTPWGLRLWAAGDGPDALRAAGVSPHRVRYWALLFGGAIASLGGVYLSISHASQFTRNMTSGRGFIALAAVIFGKWRPLPTLAACLFFGFTEASQIQLQSVALFGSTIPVQFIQCAPYAITLVVLALFAGHAFPPLALGRRET